MNMPSQQIGKSPDETKIVCMLPSATEIIHGLGLIDHLIGRSHECDFPPEVEAVPVVTFANINAHAASDLIDREVKDRLSQGLSLYGIQKELLTELQPDFIVTQTQCDVCAVSLSDVKAYLKEDIGVQAELLVLAPSVLEDVWQDIRNVSRAIGLPERGQSFVESLKSRLQAIQLATARLSRPRVAMIEWTEPLMAAGNWVPELVEIAGGFNLLGETGVHSNWMTEEELINADPDVIIVTPCGFDLERTKTEMAPLKRLSSWPHLRAVQSGKVYAVDGNAFFNRPGPRLVESAEILAEILHPQEFSFGHGGETWQQFQPC